MIRAKNPGQGLRLAAVHFTETQQRGDATFHDMIVAERALYRKAREFVEYEERKRQRRTTRAVLGGRRG